MWLTGWLLRSVTRERSELLAIRRTFDEAVLQGMRVLTLGVSLLYLVFAVMHWVFMPAHARALLLPVDFATAFLLFWVHAAIARQRVAPRHAHPLLIALGIAIMGTDVLTYALVPHPSLALNWVLVQVAAGSFALSVEWFAAFTTVSFLGWLATSFAFGGPTVEWMTYGIAVVAAVFLSAIILLARMRALAGLFLSNLRFRRLSDAAQEGIAIVGRGKVLDVNRSFGAMFGYACFDMPGMSVSELLPAFTETGFPQERGSGDSEARKRDGSIFPVEVSRRVLTRSPVRTDAISVRDLSERKRAEEIIALQRNKMIQTAKMTALGEMASGISHEIRNPLAAVTLRAQLLQRMIKQETGKEQVLKGVAGIVSDLRRIGKIVAGLSTFARASDTNSFERASLRGIIEESVAFTIDKFKRDSIELRLDPVQDIAVECRPTQISQILVNLLSNAHDAVERLEEKWVRISCEDLGAEVEISVMDSGHGIPPELRDKIMRPFFTTKGPRHGTGLGLSLSKGLAEANRGKLWLDERSTRTRFVLRLPKVQVKKAAA